MFDSDEYQHGWPPIRKPNAIDNLMTKQIEKMSADEYLVMARQAQIALYEDTGKSLGGLPAGDDDPWAAFNLLAKQAKTYSRLFDIRLCRYYPQPNVGRSARNEAAAQSEHSAVQGE